MVTRPPRAFMFIGHADVKLGGKPTLAFTDQRRALVAVKPATLANVMGQFSVSRGGPLELVFLNGCCSEDVCTEVSRRFGVATAGWRTLTADVAAKVWSIGLVERLVRDAGPLSRSNVLAAFEHGRRSVEVVANRSGRSQWAIADPAEGKKMVHVMWPGFARQLFAEHFFSSNAAHFTATASGAHAPA